VVPFLKNADAGAARLLNLKRNAARENVERLRAASLRTRRSGLALAGLVGAVFLDPGGDGSGRPIRGSWND
jgi:hypothetical protein